MYGRKPKKTQAHRFRSENDTVTTILHHAFVQYEGVAHGLKGKTPNSQELSTDHKYISFRGSAAKLRAALEDVENIPPRFFTVNGACHDASQSKILYRWLQGRFPNQSSFEKRQRQKKIQAGSIVFYHHVRSAYVRRPAFAW
eukprot:NODE_2253_length_594_cov_196.244037_g1781_i0.p1 GENE.NODE_2253_length_594_cov_196.244037_g1781_i0~~NODE_2253_length_594_cov_196.244037_g1781_i0.p1  ORF type:complete len:142 (-),score=19.42 NODE_2253_length_594_cov_196.244037_g1781_i0:28-453(-)